MAAAKSNKTRDPWFFPRCENWKVKPTQTIFSVGCSLLLFFFFTAFATSSVAMLPTGPSFVSYLCFTCVVWLSKSSLFHTNLLYPGCLDVPNSYFFPTLLPAAAPSHRVYRLCRQVLDWLPQNILGCYHALDIFVIVKKFRIHCNI